MIPDKLRLIRQTKGYSQEELARQLQVSFPTVNSWERGRVPHTPGKQHAIDMLYRAVVRAGDRNQVFIVDDEEAAGLVLADYAELALPDWKATVIDNGYDAILQIYRSSSSPTLPTNACRLLSVPRSDGGCCKPTPAA